MMRHYVPVLAVALGGCKSEKPPAKSAVDERMASRTDAAALSDVASVAGAPVDSPPIASANDGSDDTARGPHIEVTDESAETNTTVVGIVIAGRIHNSYLPGIERCYAAARKIDPKAGGSVVLEFAVTTAGKVSKARKVDGLSAAFATCVASQMSGWQFPEPMDRDLKPAEAHYKIRLDLTPG